MLNDFGLILKKDDMEDIISTIEILDNDIDKIDTKILFKNIDYLIARFRSKEAQAMGVALKYKVIGKILSDTMNGKIICERVKSIFYDSYSTSIVL